MKAGRIEERQRNIKKEKNIRREAGKGSNVKHSESEHRHWGNQKKPVCVVGMCEFMFAVFLLAQFYPNKVQNKP